MCGWLCPRLTRSFFITLHVISYRYGVKYQKQTMSEKDEERRERKHRKKVTFYFLTSLFFNPFNIRVKRERIKGVEAEAAVVVKIMFEDTLEVLDVHPGMTIDLGNRAVVDLPTGGGEDRLLEGGVPVGTGLIMIRATNLNQLL